MTNNQKIPDEDKKGSGKSDDCTLGQEIIDPCANRLNIFIPAMMRFIAHNLAPLTIFITLWVLSNLSGFAIQFLMYAACVFLAIISTNLMADMLYRRNHRYIRIVVMVGYSMAFVASIMLLALPVFIHSIHTLLGLALTVAFLGMCLIMVQVSEPLSKWLFSWIDRKFKIAVMSKDSIYENIFVLWIVILSLAVTSKYSTILNG